tara:strand:- start:575 stop:754 length:180 start_codon:yes stop_codon:yes gene_type:complete
LNNTNLGDMKMETYKMTIVEALKDQPELLVEVMKVVIENDRKKEIRQIVAKNDKIFARK